ncbi:DNA double-strand break repair nuclease NurA [Halorubellus sp. PRR65]|uniref:DNA double-strand break repair nuclease NurA n=1 Tax=Halorubellus sp. PRR65 TaxID=3098148 RepID=UPI002B25D8D9|nr:DNA double-strand break repair nuclease NurA [Halorubellus sp. PRR65]
MTLDPVHYEGIARLARRIQYDVDESDHRDVAETVWNEYLDPLVSDGDRVLEPIEDQRRLVADVEVVALADTAFESVHGLDAGTINPTTFSNGLVLDIAQAAMSATPSDLDLHRGRTMVMTVHSADATVAFDEDDWTMNDSGYVRTQIRQAPRVNRFEEGVVHALSLYRAESEHARTNADVVDDLLVLDGPIYPTGLLRWADQHPELKTVLEEEDQPEEVVENYVRLVERFVEKDVPLVGFVKNPAGNAITRVVRDSLGQAPWVDDAAMFKRLLERGEMVADEERRDADDDGPAPRRFERDTSALTATSWFVSRGGTDRVLSRHGDALGVDRRLDDEAYEVTFCAIYDPRTDVLYRLEAPYAVTRRESRREALRQWALASVAAERGPPLAVGKADELAKIGGREKRSLRETLEETFQSRRARQYDDVRWGDE